MEVAARPGWMDDEFLANCIINSKQLPKDSNINVNDAKLNYAVPKGENYMSIIYRVTVDYHVIGDGKSHGIQNGEGSTDSFIVKVSHESGQLNVIAKELKLFLKEIDMYLNIMPKLTNVLENSNIDGNIFCRCLYSEQGERDVLVMEDLKLKGYILANRLTGLDLSHTKLVYDKMAKMHAASMHYYNTHEVPNLYLSTPFDSGESEKLKDTMKVFQTAVHKRITDLLAEINKRSKYGNHIKEFFKKYDEVVLDVVNRDYKRVNGNKFNAIIHADCWVNNMMFRYDEDGSVNDVVFIDLQISYHSSVANDFTYFFFTSANNEVKKHHYRNIQEFYINSLSYYLKKMGFTGDIPTMEEFDAELKRTMLIAINSVLNTNVVILAEHKAEEKDRSKAEIFNMDEVLQMNNMSKLFTDTFFTSLDILEESGYFDNYNLSAATAGSDD